MVNYPFIMILKIVEENIELSQKQIEKYKKLNQLEIWDWHNL